MKILLAGVNAKYIHSNPAIHSLTAYAEIYCDHIEIQEYTINQYVEDIVRDIYKRKPDVLAFSCYIWNYRMIQDVFTQIHKILPELPIWLGGPEVSFDSKSIIDQYPFLSGIIVGEGEETFKELVQHYVDQNILISEIEGLVTKEYEYKSRSLIPFQTIPFFYRNLSKFKNRIIYYESMRGCPFCCSYCLSSIDKTLRTKDIALVRQELQFFLDQKVPQVKFIDRTFNCKHEHAYEVWKYIHENDNGVTNFHFEIAATILNEQEIQLLNQMRPGLVQLEIGVQTTNERTISEINRVMDVHKLEQIVSAIHKGKNVHQHLDLIAGLPYEDLASFKNSFNDVYRMQPDQLELGFLKVLKGTLMSQRQEEYELVYNGQPPYEVLSTKWITYGELQELKLVEQMVEIFYNSDQFSNAVTELEKDYETPYDLFLEMAEYFEEKGYFLKSPARAYRYQIFFELAIRNHPEKEPLYREVLTHDMYLRENLKSRSEFMQDHLTEKEKKAIRIFYKTEEKESKYLDGYAGYSAKQIERMTHIEKYMKIWGENRYVLYDYQKRNPLNQEAKTFVIELEL